MTVQIIDDFFDFEVPSTPLSSDNVPELLELREKFIEFANGYGHVIGYGQEQNGKRVQHIFPEKRFENEQISSSSKADLELHTETCFHPYRPDYVLLLCLREDESAETTYVCLEDILGNIEPEYVPILMTDQFVTTIDKSFRLNGEDDMEIKTSIFSLDENGFIRMTYDSSVMRAVTPDAEIALKALRQVISENIKSFTLRKGQIAVIDNRVTIHGRGHFEPKYDGKDRWLMRCMAIKNLPPDEFIVGNVILFSDFAGVGK